MADMQEEQKVEVGDSDESAVNVDLEKGEVLEEKEEALQVETATKEDELNEYSDGVQKRVNQLTRRFREEERQKQAAIEFAENVKKRNAELEKRIQNLDKGYQEEFGNRVESQLDVAKKVLKDAHESGDVDRIVEANEALANLSVDKVRLAAAKKQVEEENIQSEEQHPPIIPDQQQVQSQVPDPVEVMEREPKLKKWVADNPWFGRDDIMTAVAMIIEERIKEEGIDPMTDEYYAEVDKRMYSEFPHKFSKTNGGRKVASAESSASRNKSRRRTVKLTPSQVAIAKRLNVPLEEYAKFVV